MNAADTYYFWRSFQGGKRMMQIPFSKITGIGTGEVKFGDDFRYADKKFSALSQKLLSEKYPASEIFLTKSCTDALELSALVCGLQPGDEVVLPSYCFVGTANAIANRGAKCIFVDIRADTLNIDEHAIEQALTTKTKAVVAMNYAGVACNYERILEMKKKHGFILIEDNAQGAGAFYFGKPLGSFGDFGTCSFDSLKNISCGQGGCLFLNDKSFLPAIRTAFEFGTNRLDFFEGKTDKYEWKSLGSNYALAEYLAALLYPQLQQEEAITRRFLTHWSRYYEAFLPLSKEGLVDLPVIPEGCSHNGHMFHLRMKEAEERDTLISYLRKRGIVAQFHYTPLHLSEFGLKNAGFRGDDKNTVRESSRMLRLPLFFSLSEPEINYVVAAVFEFFGRKPE